MKKMALGSFGAIFVILLLCAGLLAGEGMLKSFKLKDVDGKLFRLEDYLGKKVIYLSFWASWCAPCKTELSTLNELHKKYADKNFTVIGVSVDDSTTSSQVRNYVKSKKFAFPSLLNPAGDVFFQYNPAHSLPFGLLVDQTGTIVKKYTGFQQGDEKALEEEIQKLLAPVKP